MRKVGPQLWKCIIALLVAYSPYCFASTLTLIGPSQFDVIKGIEQTIKIFYNISSKADLNISVFFNGNAVKHFYDIREDNGQHGTIYIHFLPVDEANTGNYLIFADSTNKFTITVIGVDQPTDLCKILVFVLPSIFFVVAIIATAYAVFYVKQEKKLMPKDTKKPHLQYVKRGAQVAGTTTASQQSRYSTNDSSAPSVSAVSRLAPDHPQVPQRTLSLMRPQHPMTDRNTTLPNVHFSSNTENRISGRSLDSWDDAEDEYENTCIDNTNFIDVPTSSRYPHNHSPTHRDQYPYNRSPALSAPNNTSNRSYLTENPRYPTNTLSRTRESSSKSGRFTLDRRQPPIINDPIPTPGDRSNRSRKPKSSSNYQNISH